MQEAEMYLKHHLAAEEVAIAKYCLNITHVRCSLFMQTMMIKILVRHQVAIKAITNLLPSLHS